MKRHIIVFVTLYLIILLTSGVQAQSSDPELRLHHSWGGEGNVLNVATDLSLTEDGNFLIVNGHYNRITRIAPGEENFQNFGSFGFGEGQLVNASGITIGPDGTIYVGAYGRIQLFSSEGDYLRSIWSYYNWSEGYKDDVVDIAIDEKGILHAITGYGDSFAIKSYSQEGTLIREWSTPNGSKIPLTRPVSIEMSPENNLIISDFGDNYGYGWIVVCDTEGNFIESIDQASDIEQFDKPSDVGISPINEDIFVLDAQKSRVYRFSANFDELIGSWGGFGEEPENLYGARSVEVDNQGNVIVLSSERTVQVFTQEGEYIRSYGIRADSPGQFKTPRDILVSKSGVVYVADSYNARIQAFDRNGNYLFEWNEATKGLFGYVVALSEDQAGNIYAAHQTTDQICRYTVDGPGYLCWGEYGDGQGQFENLIDVTVKLVNLPSGTVEWVYTVDNEARIQIFTTDGTFVKKILLNDDESIPKEYVSRLLVDNNGTLYVLNLGGNTIYKFDYQGQLLQKYNLFELLGGNCASALEFGPDGAIYLTNTQLNRIHRVNPLDMTLEKTWFGDYGDVTEFFFWPLGFSFSEDGLLYVMDFDNARVLVFELVDATLDQSIYSNSNTKISIDANANLVENGGFEIELHSAIWNFSGSLPSQRTNVAHSGNYALQLGELDYIGEGYAQAYTTITIPENFLFPKLNFYYQLQTNDSLELADLYVEIKDGVGLNHLEKVIQSGNGTNGLESNWQQATLSLNKFVGETIRINFIARNRTSSSTGVLAIIDDVILVSDPETIFLPMLLR